jgi:hypothetical protein
MCGLPIWFSSSPLFLNCSPNEWRQPHVQVPKQTQEQSERQEFGQHAGITEHNLDEANKESDCHQEQENSWQDLE